MDRLFFTILIPSCVGAVLTAVLGVSKRFWGRWAWLLVLLVFFVPFRIHLPETVMPMPERIEIVSARVMGELVVLEQETEQNSVSPSEKKVDAFEIISWLWLVVAVSLFAVKSGSYFLFLRRLSTESEKIACPTLERYTRRKVTVCVSETVQSPLLLGIFRPVLLLPNTYFDEKEMHHILAHETTHLKRQDVLCKWFALLVKCVHWFNPAVYFATQRLQEECEIACDLSVTAQMNDTQTRGYINTILRLASEKTAYPLTSGMTSAGRALKRRFLMIKQGNKRSWGKVAACVLIVGVILTAAVGGGVLAGELFGKEQNTEVLMGNVSVAFENRPVEKGGILYLPVRELLEQSGIDMETVTYEKGYFQFVQPLKTKML